MRPMRVADKSLALALFQPDIPQNVGAAMRLCACMGMTLHIVEPCGFPWKEREFRRAAMDYIDLADCRRHSSWEAFYKARQGRLILMTTQASTPYTSFEFREGDILVAGRESVGSPAVVHEQADARIVIPMHGPARSMNVVNACAMITGEALRQINMPAGGRNG